MGTSLDIAVVGAGSWGTALAKTLADAGHRVVLWGRNADDVASIRQHHENRRYLPGALLPETLTATTDLGAALAGKRMVVSVVPSHTVRQVFGEGAHAIDPEAIVVSASKGIENDSLETMDEVLKEVLPGRLGSRLVFLSGPSFAREVGQRLPTAVVVASRDRAAAQAAQVAFATDRFRVYTSDDVVGVEVGGALKNVMAIAAGIAEGLGMGHNTRAAIITRGLAEITRLAVRKGANPLTLAGLAGMGDLVLTCTGDLSRNRTVGLKLGQGKKLAEALAEMKQVAEGVKTTRSAHDLGERLGVELPITSTVYQVLYQDKPAMEAVTELLVRPMKHELA
ncbi:MAG TPA: NAD(P)H-dependent glycerol-3-phosphate dehydrogenase [Polyangia bacterium]|jgi:glycerol-3-phosphate dehydrogenase (NAD(P)+)|nr:NAD(P)H-dependent glycerol-3-phosphate dehydrogenase [Polyangia bacterium]